MVEFPVSINFNTSCKMNPCQGEVLRQPDFGEAKPAFARLGGLCPAVAELQRGEGGGGGIRTRDTLRHIRFPSVRTRPLCDPSKVNLKFLRRLARLVYRIYRLVFFLLR